MNKKIMIIEDDKETQFLFNELFTSENYDVISALDGNAALKEIKNNNWPDLILMDLNFPEGTPEDFLEELRKEEKGRNVPILLVSGDSKIDTRVHELKVQGYIEKPFSLDTLLEQVSQQANLQ